MKIFIQILLLIICTTSFGQKNVDIKNYSTELEETAECITVTFLHPKDSNVLVSTLNYNSSENDNNTEHYYVKTNTDKNKKIIKILKDYNVLEELFEISDDDSYLEIRSNRKFYVKNIQLIIQIDYGEPCPNYMFFVLISDKNNAVKILEELSILFKESKGFRKLKKEIKT